MPQIGRINPSSLNRSSTTLTAVAILPPNSYTKITKTNGLISQKSIYSDNTMTTELYRVALGRNQAGQILTITETDYTRNPAVVVTRTIGRVDGIDNINATGNP